MQKTNEEVFEVENFLKLSQHFLNFATESFGVKPLKSRNAVSFVLSTFLRLSNFVNIQGVPKKVSIKTLINFSFILLSLDSVDL